MKFTKKEMNPPKFRKAINDMCKDCIWDPKAGQGTWRNQVELCTSTDCSLYPLRPLTEESTQLRAEARRKITGNKISKSAFKKGNKVWEASNK